MEHRESMILLIACYAIFSCFIALISLFFKVNRLIRNRWWGIFFWLSLYNLSIFLALYFQDYRISWREIFYGFYFVLMNILSLGELTLSEKQGTYREGGYVILVDTSKSINREAKPQSQLDNKTLKLLCNALEFHQSSSAYTGLSRKGLVLASTTCLRC